MTTTAHKEPATTTVARRHDLTATQLWVALASVFAGGIHLAVTAEHLEHWWVYGAFFIVTGLFQVAFAAGWVLRRPTWPVALTGIVVNLGIVLVWVASRTTGLPVTPPEDITSEVFLRYRRALDDGVTVQSPRAFLSTTATRLS